MSRFNRFWIFAVLLACSSVTASTSVKGPLDERLAFDVLLDERVIGEHVFELRDTEEGLSVLSQAQMSVRLLFVQVFSYRHTAHELWRDGCLARLESRTRQNGRTERVQALAADDGLRVDRSLAGEPEPTAVFSDCVSSYAYWDLDRLKRDALLNAQNGVLDEVSIQPIGSRDVAWTAGSVTAYRLDSNEAEIELWYDPAGRWLGLRTLRDGRWLEYRRQ